jgi:hypothetical protein
MPDSSSLVALDLDQGIALDTINFDGCCGFENLNYNPFARSILLTYNETLFNVSLSSHEFKNLLNLGSPAELNLDYHNQVLYGINFTDSNYNIIKVDLKTNNLDCLFRTN